MTLRAWVAWFVSVGLTYSVITWSHPQFANWYVMGALVAAFWGGMLAQAPTVKERVRTLLYVIFIDEPR